MKEKSTKVIFDTNVWISFLIGKRLSIIKKYIVEGNILIVTTPQLISEIETVTQREKLKKYFPKQSVLELIALLDTIALKIDIEPTHFISRDPKDNFLLDLVEFSKADYLVTGDKDLLALNPFMTAAILKPDEFEIELLEIKKKEE
jgi:putative PIN family toxin of toxin-antitoxin system